jgi:hypothetical protein
LALVMGFEVFQGYKAYSNTHDIIYQYLTSNVVFGVQYTYIHTIHCTDDKTEGSSSALRVQLIIDYMHFQYLTVVKVPYEG